MHSRDDLEHDTCMNAGRSQLLPDDNPGSPLNLNLKPKPRNDHSLSGVSLLVFSA